MRPVCSTTNRRPEPSPAWVTNSGRSKPLATCVYVTRAGSGGASRVITGSFPPPWARVGPVAASAASTTSVANISLFIMLFLATTGAISRYNLSEL